MAGSINPDGEEQLKHSSEYEVVPVNASFSARMPTLVSQLQSVGVVRGAPLKIYA